MHMLKSLRDKLGLKVRVYEAGGTVGGTWYWNHLGQAVVARVRMVRTLPRAARNPTLSRTCRAMPRPEARHAIQYTCDQRGIRRNRGPLEGIGGECADQQQTIAAHRLADARSRQSHAEAQVLGVTELRLDRPAPGVVVDQCRCCRVPLPARQTPRFFHVLGVHADDSADELALCGYARTGELAGAPALAHPFRPGLVRPSASVTCMLPRKRLT